MAMAADSGQVVIVTGAVGNLGNAVTEAFGGARRVLVDRSAQRLAQRYPELVNAADTLLIGDVNLADEKDVRRIAAMTLERFGRIDALLNTVGGFAGGKPVHEEDLAVWDRMFEINVRTALLSCRAVIPQMIRQGTGAIVNVAARAALAGVGGLGAYCAAKSGVIRLTESIAQELKPHGVRANCVLPGTIDTPQNRKDMPEADFSKWVAPAAIARVMAFLASDAAGAITGAAVPAYGRS
jgi:NAD(P)-dependent dehydrogenase (short-subunit alcohol dehydrogenase family)